MAIAAPYTPVSVGTASTQLYSAPSTYQRDLIVTNGGPAPLYVGSATAVTAAQGLLIPAGQQVTLQGPVETVYGITPAGAATAYVGLGSVVSVI
ncbi:MAG TPA: hypothetical protein VKV80_20035 [Streptosporangiaceae bacterium]|nr:hypothetical protein [Streptosporangiaceae bacterium]